MSTKADIAPHSTEAHSVEQQPHGWIVTLLGRLGLPGGQTLRETLEEALKDAGDGRAFSAEEREMLLRILHFGTLRVVDVAFDDEEAAFRNINTAAELAAAATAPADRPH